MPPATASCRLVRLRGDSIGPGSDRVDYVVQDVSILAAGPRRDVKRMVRIREQLQAGAVAERRAQRLDLTQFGELVARALQEQHGDMHVEQMLAPLLRRGSGGMQGKSEEGQSAHSGQRREGLRLRRHPAAERFAAGNEGQVRYAPRGFAHGGADGGVRELWWIGPPAAPLHIGKLIA